MIELNLTANTKEQERIKKLSSRKCKRNISRENKQWRENHKRQ